MTKEKFYKIGYFEKQLCDFDYLKKLDKKDKKWIIQFIDEYYNGTYVENRTESKFNNKDFLKELKTNDIDAYNEFVSQFRAENLKRIKKRKKALNLTEYYVILQQREATSAKQKRRQDVMNIFVNKSENSSNSSLSDVKNRVKETKDKQDFSFKPKNDKMFFDDNATFDIAVEEKNDIENDYDKLLLLYKNNRIPIFICDKLIEMIDEKKFNSNEYKNQLFTNLKETKEQYNKNKITNYDYNLYLYKIFIIYKLIFGENEDVKVIDNIFNMIVFPDRIKVLKKYNTQK